jgi:hypothetical protein
MMTDDDRKTVDAMDRYGGSFIKALAAAMRAADDLDFATLKNSFPVYWRHYSAMAARAT